MVDTSMPAFMNRRIDKKGLRKLIAWAFANHGTAKTAQMADALKDLGFKYATRAGVSISVEDLQVPPRKKELLALAEAEIERALDRYTRGEITEIERYQKVIDTWNQTNDDIKNEMIANFEQNDPLNSVFMMSSSGARGNVSQVRQLVGMRGLMANPRGEIIDLPIKTNFREGLTVTEYIISSYGARKGLVDTALRTADSGYLTRRLVDVSQDVIVREHDCGTERGILLSTLRDADTIIIKLEERLIGRVAAQDVIHPLTGAVIVPRNVPIDHQMVDEIAQAGVEQIFMRSPLTCEANRSVCRMCYGWSMAHSHLVDIGEAVGIIAAQSIGEPGTQLTMRTFHTGGVFTGEIARQVKAPFAGTIKLPKNFRSRPYRTPHGDDALQVEVAAEFILEGEKGRKETFSATPGSTLLVQNGARVEAGQMIAEVAAAGKTAKKSTEKVQKDVATNLAGEVVFDNLPYEEKLDRQGGRTLLAQRQGIIWILSSEIYNLPPSAEPTVSNGDRIEADDVIAETTVKTEHGGTVRLPEQLDSRGTREVEIITASVVLDQATVHAETQQGREHYVLETRDGQTFLLKATPGSKVGSGEVVAELQDNAYRSSTGGMVKFAGLEVAKRGKAKQGFEVTKGGTLLWIPEETHEVNKDISLLNVEDGQYVEAGTEVVKDIFCNHGGVVEVVQKNDILREIVIKPGQLYMIDNPADMEIANGTLVAAGQAAMTGVTAESLVYLEHIETTEGPAILLRPVEEYTIPDEPSIPSQDSTSESGPSIRLRAVQRLPFKDGERVKSVQPVELLKTQLSLDIDTDAQHLKADIELIEDGEAQRLQLVILETLLLRRDIAADITQGSTRTSLQVADGDVITAGSVVARTAILAKQAGIVRGIRRDGDTVRRLAVLTSGDQHTLALNGAKPLVKEGALVRAGDVLAEGVTAPDSGQIIAITKDSILVRIGRPYLVSGGAILQQQDGDLVQRGDTLAYLVYERAKTGDIIQGLPRIEELLEARKPKEMCLLAKRPGVVQLVRNDDDSFVMRIQEADGMIEDYPLLLGQNPIVADGQEVNVGEPITDGPSNPHDILDSYFQFYRYQVGVDEAALMAVREVQRFFVNEVQTVYRSQGVDIADKHVEIVVRQMTSKVRIDDGGDTILLPGELIELSEVQKINSTQSITGGAPAEYTPVLLGITKASLNTSSFISAASFQETTRVLTEAAIEGKSDYLRGLKENVIIGRLIPAGTGYNTYTEETEDVPDVLPDPEETLPYSRSRAIEDGLVDDHTPLDDPALMDLNIKEQDDLEDEADEDDFEA